MPKVHKVYHNSDDSDAEPHYQRATSDDDGDDELLASGPRHGENEEEGGKDSSDDDSDAEPESVAFTDSKKTVLDRVRSAIKQIERDNQQLKTTRRRKHDMFSQQKKQKLEKTLRKLPEDVLGAMPSERAPAPIALAARLVARPAQPKSGGCGSVDTAAAARRKKSSVGAGKLLQSEDYIPLSGNSDVIKAVSLDTSSSIATSSARGALRFKQRQMYGPNVRRPPVSKFIATGVKRKMLHAK